METVSKKLAAYLKKRNLTQRQFSRLSRIDETTIRNIRLGMNPNVTTLIVLANNLGLTISELFRQDHEEETEELTEDQLTLLEEYDKLTLRNQKIAMAFIEQLRSNFNDV